MISFGVQFARVSIKNVKIKAGVAFIIIIIIIIVIIVVVIVVVVVVVVVVVLIIIEYMCAIRF